MHELRTWDFSGSEVRTIEMNGEPWWVLKDVCDVLELGSPHKVADRLEEDERNQIPLTDSLGREQNTTIVNESGLYSVILRSDKPQAKPFRKWVTSEVLPAIRKTGSYSIMDSYQIDDPIERAKRWIEEQQEKKQLSAKVSTLTVDNAIMQPKADYFDQLVDRNLLTNLRDTAKELHIKQNAFVAFLLEKKYMFRDAKGKLMPYAKHVDAELFEIKEFTNEKTGFSSTQALITPKGRETFRLLITGS